MKIAVVTDSTAVLPSTILEHPDLYVIPIPVIIDDVVYNEGSDISANEFYTSIATAKFFPKTSQPAVGEVLELYQQLAHQGYDSVISIHLSSGISGFVMNLQALSETISEIDIYPFDSKITSMPMGYMVSVALEMCDEGYIAQDILSELDYIRSYMGAYMIVDDLNHLVRGGRLTNGAAVLGSLLKIKPVLTFKDGDIIVFEKIRSSKKAFKRVESLLGDVLTSAETPMKIFVIHADNLVTAEQEYQQLTELYPETDISIGEFGPVIGTHLGRGAIGFGWAPLRHQSSK